MYNDKVKKYIHLLKIEHVKSYLENKNINVTDCDANTIYNFILNNYEDMLTGNIDSIRPLYNLINTNTYNSLLILYKEACAKYL